MFSQIVRRAATRVACARTVQTTLFRSVVMNPVPNPPDIMIEKLPWKRQAIDEEPLPDPDLDERRSDDENDYVSFDNQEIESILDEEYVEPEIIAKFARYMKLVSVCKPVEFYQKDVDINATLKIATRAFFKECETAEHYDGIITGSSRCYDVDYHLETLEMCRSVGHVITDLHTQHFITFAVYHRSREMFEFALKQMGDRATWDNSSWIKVMEFHELMGDYVIADEIYESMIVSGKLQRPWRPVFRSHVKAVYGALTVPTRSPMYDPRSPMADVIQLNALPYYAARAAFRYAVYNMQGTKRSDQFPPIRVPHHLTFQAYRRTDGDIHHKEWTPAKQSLRAYVREFGIEPQNIDRAAPVNFIKKEDFSKLPTPEMIKELSIKHRRP